MAEEVIEIWEPREVWLRVASMWSVCYGRAKRSSLTDRTWNVMPKIAAQITARCRSGDATVALSGSRDGWAILTGWLSNVQCRQVLTEHGGQVFTEKERQFAGELGHRLILGTSVCESFKETKQ
jgi:hypothetical protein